MVQEKPDQSVGVVRAFGDNPSAFHLHPDQKALSVGVGRWRGALSTHKVGGLYRHRDDGGLIGWSLVSQLMCLR